MSYLNLFWLVSSSVALVLNNKNGHHRSMKFGLLACFRDSLHADTDASFCSGEIWKEEYAGQERRNHVINKSIRQVMFFNSWVWGVWLLLDFFFVVIYMCMYKCVHRQLWSSVRNFLFYYSSVSNSWAINWSSSFIIYFFLIFL